ncbi:MAG TPA: LamG domain-containing protein [Polyangiaceae bacterium]|nr:LamG domain-containing protein [Polyangiaceae bacterium]
MTSAGKTATAGTSDGGTQAVPQGGTGGSGGTTSAGAGTTSSAGTAGSSSGGGGSGGGGSGSSAGGDGGEGGTPDVPATCTPCKQLKSALVHRYDFEGSGTAVMDRVGTAHGAIQGGGALSTVDGKGVVVLGGGTTGPYVDLPNGIVSSLTNATFESWVTWGGGNAWQRIFDFGDSTAATPEDNPANGKRYLFLTPMSDANSGGSLRVVYSLDGGAATAETRLDGISPLPQALKQVVVVVNATGGKLLLYVDGLPVSETAFAGSLGSINDVNVWLGRSQYGADPELTGTFHDFRIYKAALSAAQIAASFAGGTDPAFLVE